jgi:hypothetical protein
MKHPLPLVALCRFSRSAEGVQYAIDGDRAEATCIAERLDECPLDLPASRARICPCKRNVRLGSNFDGASIKGASCTHPLLSDGEPIRSVPLLRAWILRQ